MSKTLHACLFSAFLLFAGRCFAAPVVSAAWQGAFDPHAAAKPVLFCENKGQVDDGHGRPRADILFTASGNGAAIFLTATGIHYQFSKTEYPEGYLRDERRVTDHALQEALRKQIKSSTHRFTVSLAGANPHPQIIREEQHSYTENFYRAVCPDGVTGVRNYGRLVYKEVYPGIDWVIYSNGSGLKYDFLVYPGADPDLIKLNVSDAESVRLTGKGDLVISSALGEIKEAGPVAFCGGKKIKTRFVLDKQQVLHFETAPYNKQQTLTIDPYVTWATYYGGSGADYANSCTTDASGNVYLAGNTTSTASIASGGFQNTYTGGGTTMSFLAKFNSAGVRLWATYYGDSTYRGSCVADVLGNIYLAGNTAANTGIAAGGFQNTLGGDNDGFLVKFNNAGIRLWSTYFGGPQNEQVASCKIDALNNVYIAGTTESVSGIASGGFQNTYGGGQLEGDAFLAKFNSAGNRLWSTYYGGINDEVGNDCTTDAAGNVYLTGHTSSPAGISSGGFQNVFLGGGPNSSDAYLVKFNSAGNRLWSTYYGGTLHDVAWSCATDISGNVYMAGSSKSTGNIASGGHQNINGGFSDAYLVKFNSAGNRLWGTFYGGGNDDFAVSCVTDGLGSVYIAGYTGSSTGIALNGMQNMFSGVFVDAFIAKFNSAGARQWGSYFGGTGEDRGFGLATDGAGTVYLAGDTRSTSGIAGGGHQNSMVGAFTDGFLVRINELNTSLSSNIFCTGSALSISYSSVTTFTSGNVFTAQLSDASGSFTSPVAIGTLSSAGSTGTIAAVIPAATVPGTGYRIRVISSMPLLTGDDNGSDLTITNTPAVPGVITGNQTVCAGTTQVYSIAPVPGATLYNWLLPSGWSGLSTTASITTIAGNSGTITVSAGNSCGTSSPASLPVSNNGFLPSRPGAITGPDTVCNGNTRTYSTAPVAGATSYAWTLPGGWSGSSASPSITVTAGSASGPISVTAGNSCGNGPAQTRNIIAADIPPMPGAITGSTPVCQLTIQGYTVPPLAGPVTYNWVLPATWTGSSTTAAINTTVGTAGGNIMVSATNTCGTSTPQSKSIIVRPYTIQPPPVISFTGNKLVSDVAGVQWYGPNGLIPGAIGETYTPVAPGVYYAVKLNNGCDSGPSNTVQISAAMLAIGSTGLPQVSVSPVPTTGKIYIDWKSQPQNGTIAVYNTTGQKVRTAAIAPNSGKEIDLSPFADGVYFMTLQDSAGQFSRYNILLSR